MIVMYATGAKMLSMTKPKYGTQPTNGIANERISVQRALKTRSVDFVECNASYVSDSPADVKCK